MSYRIETIDESGVVKVLPTEYDDLRIAKGVAQSLHDIEHIQLGVKTSNGVRIMHDSGKMVWERTTSHDYLNLDPSEF